MPSSDVDIGAVRPDELESLLELLCEAFELPMEPARDIFYKDPYLNLNNKRVLRVNGRIVSCLTVIDRTVWIDGTFQRVGGIAGVATHQTERGKGYAGRLLRDTLDFLHAEGYVLSALIPYSSHFYRRLGWELCGTACRFVTSPTFLPTGIEGRHVRPARQDDLAEMSVLYDEKWLRWTFHAQRDTKRWDYIWTHVKQCYVYQEPNAPISGYVLSDLRANAPLFEGENPAPTLRVLELVVADEKAQRGLITHLATQIHAREIEVCEVVWAARAWSMLNLMGVGVGAEILANIEIVPMLMVRIIHFKKMLEWAVHFFPYNEPGYSRGVRCVMHDLVRFATPEQWTMMFEEIGPVVRPTQAEDSQLPCLSGDARAWAQVLTGFRTGAEALSQGLLQLSGELSDNQLGCLFGNSCAPFLPLPDHF